MEVLIGTTNPSKVKMKEGPMRIKDREVTDELKIEKIINACDCIRIGFIDHNEVYIVPMNFGYQRDQQYVFYFHSAKEGRKVELIKENPRVGFEMDTKYELATADIACQFSSSYQSIIGSGVIQVIEGNEEKRFALNRMMHKNTGKDDWTFDQKAFDHVITFKLIVDTLSFKEHK